MEGEPPRGLLVKPCVRACVQRKMESKVPRLGLALKRRKTTPLRPGGKEVRGSLSLCSAPQLPLSGFESSEERGADTSGLTSWLLVGRGMSR